MHFIILGKFFIWPMIVKGDNRLHLIRVSQLCIFKSKAICQLET